MFILASLRWRVGGPGSSGAEEPFDLFEFLDKRPQVIREQGDPAAGVIGRAGQGVGREDVTALLDDEERAEAFLEDGEAVGAVRPGL